MTDWGAKPCDSTQDRQRRCTWHQYETNIGQLDTYDMIGMGRDGQVRGVQLNDIRTILSKEKCNGTID
jgi:hypothetical protein